MEDLYQTLQVDPGAEPEVIDAAWRRLAQIYHPDGGLRPDAERMTAVNRAHQILKDPLQRAEYDRRREGHARPPSSPSDGRPEMATPARGDMAWVAAPALRCWRHQAWAAARCGVCGSPLCDDCAARWQPPHCDRCMLARGHNQQAWIVWPLAASAAWLMLVVTAYAGGWQTLFAVKPGWTPPLWPTLLVTYILGAGVVGGVDLMVRLWRATPRDTRRYVSRTGRGFLVLVLLPLSIVAGSVFVPVRGVLAVVAFLNGTATVRVARAALRGGGGGDGG